MIYKNIDKFLQSFITREVANEEHKAIFENKILEIVTYFKLLYINSGQGAFYNILSSYISDDSGLHDLLKKSYDRHIKGILTDEDGSVEIIIKSIFQNNFLKKFDKEAKVALPPIVAIFFSGFYEETDERSWLKVSRDRVIEVDVSSYGEVLQTAKEKDLEIVGVELIEDFIAIREREKKIPRAVFKPAYMLLAESHGRFKHTKQEFKNYEKVIEINEENNDIASEDMIFACNRSGEIFQEQKSLIKAITYYEKALKAMVALRGFQHISVGKQNELIATTLLLLGDIQKACKALTMVASNYEANFGIENIETIRIINTITDLQLELSDYNGVYKTYTRVYDNIISLYGANSEEVIIMQTKLSIACKNLKKIDEMEKLHTEVLDTIHYNFEDLHYTKGQILVLQAEIKDDKKEYKEAIELYDTALEVYVNTIGESDERTLDVYNHLGLINEKLKQFDESLMYYEKEYIIRKIDVEEENLKIINLKEKIGNIYRLKGNFPNALSYLNEALEYKDIHYPDDHDEKLTLFVNLGKLYRDTGNYVLSFSFLEKALAIAIVFLDELDPLLIEIFMNIARLKKYNKDVEGSVESYLEAASRYEKRDEMLDVAFIYKKITALYLRNELYDEATDYAIKSKVTTEMAVGPDDILNLDCMNLLAHVYNEAGDGEKAILAYQDVCKIIIEKFGKVNHNLAIAYENMSGVFVKLEKLNSALDFLNLALTINEKIFGENSSEVSNNYSNIAFIEYLQKKHNEALIHYEKVLQINEQTNRIEASFTSEILFALGRLYESLNDHTKALKYYKRSMILQETVINDLEVVIEENFLIEQCYKFEEEGKYTECINVFEQYIHERTRKQGVHSIGKGSIYRKIAECYKALPDSNPLLQVLYLNKSLLVKARIYGDKNPAVANDYVDFAILNRDRGERKVSLEYFSKALDIFKIVEENNVFQMAELKLNIGSLLRDEERFSEAIGLLTEAYEYFVEDGTDQNLIWKSLTELGNTYLEADETSVSLEFYQKAEKICKEDRYFDKGCAGITFYNLGDAYRKLNKKRDAVMYYEKALTIEREVHGVNSFLTGALETNIGLIYKSVGQNEKALECFERAKVAYKNSVGDQDNNFKYINILIEEVKLQVLYEKDKNEVTGMKKILNVVKGY